MQCCTCRQARAILLLASCRCSDSSYCSRTGAERLVDQKKSCCATHGQSLEHRHKQSFDSSQPLGAFHLVGCLQHQSRGVSLLRRDHLHIRNIGPLSLDCLHLCVRLQLEDSLPPKPCRCHHPQPSLFRSPCARYCHTC